MQSFCNAITNWLTTWPDTYLASAWKAAALLAVTVRPCLHLLFSSRSVQSQISSRCGRCAELQRPANTDPLPQKWSEGLQHCVDSGANCLARQHLDTLSTKSILLRTCCQSCDVMVLTWRKCYCVRRNKTRLVYSRCQRTVLTVLLFNCSAEADTVCCLSGN